LSLTRRLLETRTTLANPAQWLIDWVAPDKTVSGQTVNETTALGFSAYFAAIRNISEDIASLPLKILEDLTPRGTRAHPEHPVQRLFNRAPSDDMTAFTFRQTWLAHALGWKGGFAEIVRDGAGRPTALYVLDPSTVTIFRNEYPPYQVYYEIQAGQTKVQIAEDSMLHLHGLGLNGVTGYVMAQVGKHSLGAALAAQKFRGAYFGNGAVATGALEYPGILKPEAYERLRKSFEARYAGADNAHKTIILEEGAKFTPLSIDPDKSQMIEALYFDVEDVCRWFRINPNKLQHWLRTTFNNVEASNIDHVQDTLLPWCIRIEQEVWRKLLTVGERERLYAKHNLSGRLRGDVASRSSFYNSQFNVGALSPNDIRELEDMNPIGPEGDLYYVNSATVPLKTLEQQAEAPIEPVEPEEPPVENEDEDDNGEELAERAKKTINAYLPLIVNEFKRTARVSQDKIERAKRDRKNAEEYAQWLNEYIERDRAYVIEQINRHVRTINAILDSLINGNEIDEASAQWMRLMINQTCDKHVQSIAAGHDLDKTVDESANSINTTLQNAALSRCIDA
jgi:HK97 family phage portal protein